MNYMNFGVIVNKGFEHAAVRQIRELIEDVKDLSIDDTFVSFKHDSWDSIYRFIYRNQIATRVVYLIGKLDFELDDGTIQSDEFVDEVRKVITRSNDDFLKSIITTGTDFRVSLEVDLHTDVSYPESEIGGILLDCAKALDKPLKVNLKTPALNLYIHAHNGSVYVGIDLSGDLSKRDYKIFNNAVSLKGPTAFGLLMIAEFNPKDVYLNPCCYSGTIEIEAALYATHTSHRFYNKSFPFMKLHDAINGTESNQWDKFFSAIDKERLSEAKSKKFSITGSDRLLSSITAAGKNAKIAGMEQFLDFRRIDHDWMDIKFEENSIDRIVSFIPGSSKHDKNISKEYKEIFYQAEYILKKDGKLVIMCLSKDLLISASTEYFDLDHELVAHSGAQIMFVLFFKRKNK
jgi:23S rRNA G2445 N2-methylase RlmL